MSKKIKFLIISIAFVIFCNTLPVFASITEETNTKNINISNLEAGVRVELYRLATVNYDYIANQPKDVEYAWSPAIETWLEENDSYSNYVDPEMLFQEVESMSNEAKVFYDSLTNAIKGGDIELYPVDEKSTSGSASYPVTQDKLDKTVVFENQTMGTYLVIIENGYRVYTPSVINLVPKFDENSKEWILEDQNVKVKSTTPKIIQTVTDNDKIVDNYSTIDTIPYTIVADVPTYLQNSLSKKYVISNDLEESMSINQDSIEIYGVNGTSEVLLDTGYTLAFNSTRPVEQEINKSTFVIDFDYDSIKNYEKIKIKYTAKLNQDNSLIITESGNKSIVYLDYTNNPYEYNSYETQEYDEVIVFSYGIEITKKDKATKNTLAGAEFSLLDKDDNVLYFVKVDNGIYYLSTEETNGATTNLVVNKYGGVSLIGLDEGTYTIKETHAPNGYNISTNTCDIALKDTSVDGKLDGDSDGIYSFDFLNTKKFFIPLTGGKGIHIFVIFGVLFISLGSISFIFFSKIKKMKESV